MFSEFFGLNFFFQAEDGIRDSSVTGVQTCALPISHGGTAFSAQRKQPHVTLGHQRNRYPARLLPDGFDRFHLVRRKRGRKGVTGTRCKARAAECLNGSPVLIVLTYTE